MSYYYAPFFLIIYHDILLKLYGFWPLPSISINGGLFMSTRSQELELRNIMQGLEEFATFMSYQSDYSGLRIISVETATPEENNEEPVSADIVSFPLQARAC